MERAWRRFGLLRSDVSNSYAWPQCHPLSASEHAPLGELRIAEAVDDVMRDAGVVGILRLQLSEDIGA
jgi:hypothetical protein